MTSAQVTLANGSIVTLHNPGDYAGDYQCSDAQCAIVVEPQDVLCTDKPLTNPEAECGFFGLIVQGKTTT